MAARVSAATGLLIIAGLMLAPRTHGQPATQSASVPPGSSDVLQASIHVDAAKVIQIIAPRILGSNIEDLNFQCYGGVYSQLLHGESFQEHIDPGEILGLTGQARLTIYVREIEPGKPQLFAFNGRGWDGPLARQLLSIAGGGDAPVSASELPADRRGPFLEAATGIGQVSRQWRALANGSAKAAFRFDRTRPFNGTQSQRIAFVSGAGEVGIDNAGLNRWGIHLVEGKPYEGRLRVRAERACTLHVSLRSADGHVLAENAIELGGNSQDYQRVEFRLTPSADDEHGRFAVTIREPGEIALGYAFLQPGPWGRFRGLPLRKQLVHAVIEQGIKVMRYNGSMVNRCPDGHLYKWKEMIGPRDERSPYQGWFNPYASHGFAIFEFLDMCQAAGFLGVPGVRIDETADDMADFVEYAKGPAGSEWGGRRAADGHAAPYKLTHVQIGNEETLDEQYVERFITLGTAIWSKDPTITLVVSQNLSKRAKDWAVEPGGAVPDPLRLAMKIVQFGADSGGTIWWDCHYRARSLREVDAPNNRFACMRNLRKSVAKLLPGYDRFRLAPLEENGSACNMERALAHARNLHALMRMGRLPAAAVANTFQADGQNLVWNQGRTFFNASQVWFQPPYYVDQMVHRNWAAGLVETKYASPRSALDAVARISEDRSMLVLQVANIEPNPVETKISINRFAVDNSAARVIQLRGDLQAENSSDAPARVVPTETAWKHGAGVATFAFPPYSFTMICWEAKGSPE